MGNAGSPGCVCLPQNSDPFGSTQITVSSAEAADASQELEDLRRDNHQLHLDHDRLQQELARERPSDLPLGSNACEGSVPQVINDLVTHMWPFISQYVHNLLKDSVEPMVQQMLPKFVGFKFSDTRCHLGKTPPELGVTVTNVHDQASAEFGEFKSVRIVAEVLYDGDCEVEVLALRTSIGINCFQVVGFLVVELVHLMDRPPMFQGLRIYFINPPEIRIGMEGGLGHVANTNYLKRTIVDAVSQIIAGLMVLPNRITVPLEDELNIFRLKSPPPEGVLRVVIERARGLNPGEQGLVDPYVVVQVGAESCRTATRARTLDPVWESDNTFDFVVYDKNSQQLRMSLFDQDYSLGREVKKSFSKRRGACCCRRQKTPVMETRASVTPGENLSSYVDDFLGSVQVSLNELLVNLAGEAWLDLRSEEALAPIQSRPVSPSHTSQGFIRIRAEFRPFESEPALACSISGGQAPPSWSIPNCAEGVDTIALLFAGLFGANGLPYPPKDSDLHWCTTTVTEAGRMGVTETKESPRIPSLHPVHRFQLGWSDDPQKLEEQRKKVRATIDLLHTAAVPPETISEAVGLPLHCINAQVNSSPDVDKVFAAADVNSVDVRWEEPMFFALRSLKSICTFKFLRGDGAPHDEVVELGSASSSVEALLTEEKLTSHTKLKVGDAGEFEVALKLLVLGSVSAGCGFSKAADS